MAKGFFPIAALVSLTASTAVADLTKFDYEYDGHVLQFRWTMSTVKELVDAQEDEWLSAQYNATATTIGKSIDAGTVTTAEFLQAFSDFYSVADTKFADFQRAATTKIAQNGADVSVVNVVEPEAWCDYVFGEMYAIAKESGSAELKTVLETAQKKIEDGITKRIPPKEVNALVVTLYSDGNKAYASFTKELSQKLEDFGAKLQEEAQAVVIKKATTAPSPAASSSSASASTPAPAGASASSSPSSAPAPTSSGAATGVVSALTLVVAAVAASFW